MPTYYVFKGTTNSALKVTADRSGANLPNHLLALGHSSRKWISNAAGVES